MSAIIQNTLVRHSVGSKHEQPCVTLGLVSPILDAAITVTALILGILAATGSLNFLPPAAAFGLIPLGAAIPILYILLAVANNHQAKLNSEASEKYKRQFNW